MEALPGQGAGDWGEVARQAESELSPEELRRRLERWQRGGTVARQYAGQVLEWYWVRLRSAWLLTVLAEAALLLLIGQGWWELAWWQTEIARASVASLALLVIGWLLGWQRQGNWKQHGWRLGLLAGLLIGSSSGLLQLLWLRELWTAFNLVALTAVWAGLGAGLACLGCAAAAGLRKV